MNDKQREKIEVMIDEYSELVLQKTREISDLDRDIDEYEEKIRDLRRMLN